MPIRTVVTDWRMWITPAKANQYITTEWPFYAKENQPNEYGAQCSRHRLINTDNFSHSRIRFRFNRLGFSPLEIRFAVFYTLYFEWHALRPHFAVCSMYTLICNKCFCVPIFTHIAKSLDLLFNLTKMNANHFGKKALKCCLWKRMLKNFSWVFKFKN